MRMAGGILMILGGFIGGTFFVQILHELHVYGALIYLPLCLAVIGGIMALKRVHYNWALAGAICSILFPPFGIPAVIFLVKRKGEFSSHQTAMQGWKKSQNPTGQITKKVAYGCRNLIFKEGRCHCAYGRKLSMAKDGSISARLILLGTVPPACKVCELYSDVVSARKGKWIKTH